MRVVQRAGYAMERAARFVNQHLAVITFCLVVFFIGFYMQRERGDREEAQRQATAERLILSNSLCRTTESLVNAFIVTSKPPTDPTAAQERLDGFERTLEQYLEPIGCDLHLKRVDGH